MGNARTRNWSFIAYPDSAPEDWKSIIKALHIPCCISPLHDKDLNPTGEEKKPHWHIFLVFDSVKTYDQALEITKLVNGTIPQPVQSPVGLVRYFIHKDNPEKHQYKFSDIEVYNGFDVSKYDTYSEAELDSIFKEITEVVDANCIYEISDLWEYCRDNNPDWLRLLRKNTIFFNSYVSSRRHKFKEWQKQTIANN